jgi:hypothetical protein
MAGRRFALIVATDEYLDPGLAKLRSPATDAEALAGVLADPEIGDFEVDVLRNGTSSAIAEHVDSLLNAGKLDDLIVLHFSCHGIKDDSGELYLAATNTRPGLLPSTAVDASLVNRLMRRSRAQRAVLFLDCCFGGAFERGLVPRAAGVIDVADQFRQREDGLGGGRGRVVITASNAMEFAFEGTNLADAAASRPSIFTGALVEGLRTGAADHDQDGVVSLGELYEYVFERVRDVTPSQTPGKWEFGLQGDLVLAKNPHRMVRPAPPPLPSPATASIPPTVAPATMKPSSVGPSRSPRRLLERGWQTGHLQTLAGAELGAFAVWGTTLSAKINEWANSIGGSPLATPVTSLSIWMGAALGAWLVLHLTGPVGSRRIVVALILLYPVFHVFAKDSLYPNPLNYVLGATLIAVLALVAATVVRLRRPEAA